MSIPLVRMEANKIGVCRNASAAAFSGGRCVIVTADWEIGYPTADGSRIFGVLGSTNLSGVSAPLLVTREGVVNLQDHGAGLSAGNLVRATVGGFVGVVTAERAEIGSGLVANTHAIGWVMEDIAASGYGPIALFGID